MSRSVTLGGQTLFHPGGLTSINTDGLTSIGLTSTGIIQLLGEADGGQPAQIIQIDDPSLAKTTFRSGPLADAIRIAFSASGDRRITGGAFRVLAYKTNNSTKSGTQLPSATTLISDTVASATTTVITLTTGALTPSAHVGRWLQISNIKRRIVANDASTVTVSPGFPSAPAGTTPVVILASAVTLSSKDWGVHTNQVAVEVEPGVGTGFVTTVSFGDTVNRSPEIGGTSALNIMYGGGPVSDTGLVTSASGVTVGLTVTQSTTADLHAGKILRFSNGLQRLILSNTADTSGPFTITVTLAAGHDLTTAEGAALVGTTASIVNVTAATASIAGANGVATTLTSTVSPTADNLSITFPAGQTLQQLVDYVNGNTNYIAVIPDGVNGDTVLMSTFDFDSRNTSVDVRFDHEISFNTKGTFRRDLQALVDWVNEFSTLATAVKATAGTQEGAGLPAFTGGVSSVVRDVPVYFIGGTRGTSSNSSFQSGFDALIQKRANHCVPLISQDLTNEGNGSTATVASVAQQLLAHVQLGRGIGKNEMGGYLGYKGTLTAILAQAAALNDQDVQLFPQQMTFLNVSGTLTLMPEWAMAVAAASMRSGADEVGTPLTYKFIKTTEIANDTSWSPTDRTNVNQLIQGGVMFAEEASGGIRFVRDLTTHIQDDLIVFTDGNMKEEVRFIAFDLRQSLEDQFTGDKGTPASVASMRDFAAAKLQAYREQNIITNSLDPETLSTIVPGFRHLRVFLDGNIATIRVEVFPAPGVVFELNEISLQLPRLAA